MKKQYLSGIFFEEKIDIAKITLQKNKKNKYLDLSFISDLNEVFNYVDDSPQIKTLLINITSDSYLDFNYLSLLEDKDNAVSFFSKWESLIATLEKISKLTIIQLAGDIEESKFHLAMGCDFKICLKNTRFIMSSIDHGLIPGMLVFKLAKYMGLGNAKSVILNDKIIDADTALDHGLVNKIVDKHDDDFLFSNFLCCHAYKKNPCLIPIIRRLLNESFHSTFEDSIGNYLAAQDRCIHLLE